MQHQCWPHGVSGAWPRRLFTASDRMDMSEVRSAARAPDDVVSVLYFTYRKGSD